MHPWVKQKVFMNDCAAIYLTRIFLIQFEAIYLTKNVTAGVFENKNSFIEME